MTRSKTRPDRCSLRGLRQQLVDIRPSRGGPAGNADVVEADAVHDSCANLAAPFALTAGETRRPRQLRLLPGGTADLLPAWGLVGEGGVDGGQGEAVRVPQADGTLVVLPVGEDDALMPSLLSLSDVMATGHHAALAARLGPGATRTTANSQTLSESSQRGARRFAPRGPRTTSASTTPAPKRFHHPVVGDLSLTFETSPRELGGHARRGQAGERDRAITQALTSRRAAEAV
jgi:hypothetical protein